MFYYIVREVHAGGYEGAKTVSVPGGARALAARATDAGVVVAYLCPEPAPPSESRELILLALGGTAPAAEPWAAVAYLGTVELPWARGPLHVLEVSRG